MPFALSTRRSPARAACKEANELFILKISNCCNSISENFGNVAQDVATSLQIWIYFKVNSRLLYFNIILLYFPFYEKCRQIPTNFHQERRDRWQILLRKMLETWKFEKWILISKNSGRICWNCRVGAVKKSVNLVDLVKSFHTSIYLQNRLRHSRERASHSLEVLK